MRCWTTTGIDGRVPLGPAVHGALVAGQMAHDAVRWMQRVSMVVQGAYLVTLTGKRAPAAAMLPQPELSRILLMLPVAVAELHGKSQR